MRKTTMAVFALFAPAAVLFAAPSPVDGFPEMPDMPREFRASRAEVLKAAEAATREKFPDADFVVLDDRIHTRYEPDGTQVEWDEEWILALTEKGRRELSSQSMNFSQRYGDASILECEIISPDGSTREIPATPETLRVSTDNSSMSQNIYDPLDKTLNFSVPGVKTGDIRRMLTCRRMLKPRAKDFWGDISVLEYTAPIIATTVTVDAPAARLPKSIVLRHPVEGTVKRAEDAALPGGRTLYKWEVRNIPQVHAEPDSPPLYTQVQALKLSTASDWNEISVWYWNLCKPHLEKTTPEIKAKVEELVKGLDTQEEKIRAIYKFVSQEIRYMGLTIEDTAPGYEPHDIDITFKNRYGVCRDKAALLAAMLREAGMRAYPVLIHAGAKLDDEVPQPYFNHAITAVERDGIDLKGADRYILMDSTDETSRDLLPAYLSNRSFLVAREAGETLLVSPTAPASENLFEAASEGILSPDGSIFMKTRLRFLGMNDNIYRSAMLACTPEERRKFFERVLSAVAPGSEMLDFKLEPSDLRDTSMPVCAEFSSKIRSAVLSGETLDMLSVPFFSSRVGFANFVFAGNTSLPKRRFTLEAPATAESRETVRIETAGALGALKNLPASVDAGTEGGFSFSLGYAFTNGTLCASRSWKSEAVEYPPEKYGALKDALAKAEVAERPTPVFAKRAGDDADVRILADLRTVNLETPWTWVETNATVKTILSYNGKKQASDIQFSYNPAWEEIEILQAAVIDPEGGVRMAGPHEINEMDAGWTGSAPRYSPAKIKVVNLPGMEIGSKVQVVTVRRVKDSPAPFALNVAFGGANPCEKAALAVTAPADMPLDVRDNMVDRSVVTNELNEVVYEWQVVDSVPLPSESSRPPSLLWRPSVRITSGADCMAEAAGRAAALLREARSRAGEETARRAREFAEGASGAAAAAEAIRNGMSKSVRIVPGPGLWNLPASPENFASPDDVLREGYASGYDYANTLAALLESAGFKVEYLLTANDPGGVEELKRYGREHPDVRNFSSGFLRVRPGRRWYWPFSSRPEWWIGPQNEYTPLETCAYAGETVVDPADFEQFELSGVAPEALDSIVNEISIDAREDGSVRADYKMTVTGPSVGSFRKKWSEILPEDRERAHAALVQTFSKNAKAAGPLETDVESYPGTTTWSAEAPQYAVVENGTMTLEIPVPGGRPFAVSEGARYAPILVSGPQNHEKTVVKVRFPDGWTKVEHAPEPYILSFPRPGGSGVMEIARSTVEISTVADPETGAEHLEAVLAFERPRSPGAIVLEPGAAALLNAWNRRLSEPGARTIAIRKP